MRVVQSSAPRRLKKTKVLDMSVVLTILVHYSESSRQTAKGCAYQSRQTMNKRKENNNMLSYEGWEEKSDA
jgi:hypothetical protein